MGKRWIRSTATTQGPIALSSGESEFHAVVKGTSTALGLQVMLSDYGVTVDVVIHVDATAGIGIASRRGLGRVRHLHTPLLWVQKVFQERRAEARKIAGPKNPADLGTKLLSAPEIWRHLIFMGFEARSGQSSMQLKAAAS